MSINKCKMLIAMSTTFLNEDKWDAKLVYSLLSPPLTSE